jgi:hypothetical protein
MKLKYDTDIRLRHECLDCNQIGRPLKRVWGYPGKEAFKLEAEGRIRLMGCCITPDQAGYECRHCGIDWRIVRL